MVVSWRFGVLFLALCHASPTHRGSKQLFQETADALDNDHGSGDGSGLGALPEDHNEEPTIDQLSPPNNSSSIASNKVPMIEDVESGSGWHEVAFKEEKYVYLVSIEYNADGTVKKFENISVPLSQLMQHKKEPFSVKLQGADKSFVLPQKTFLQTKSDINPVVPVKETLLTAQTILATAPVIGTSSLPVEQETSPASPISPAGDVTIASTQSSVHLNQVTLPSNQSDSSDIHNASNSALSPLGENEIKPSNLSIEAVSASPISVTTEAEALALSTEAAASSTGATGADSIPTNSSTAALSPAIGEATATSLTPELEAKLAESLAKQAQLEAKNAEFQAKIAESEAKQGESLAKQAELDAKQAESLAKQAESVGARNNASTEGDNSTVSSPLPQSNATAAEDKVQEASNSTEQNILSTTEGSFIQNSTEQNILSTTHGSFIQNNTNLEQPIAHSLAVEKIISSSTQSPLTATEAIQVTSGIITMAESHPEVSTTETPKNSSEQLPAEQSVAKAVVETYANESTKLLVKEVTSVLKAEADSADNILDKKNVQSENATKTNEEKAPQIIGDASAQKTNSTENAPESLPNHAENIANNTENALPSATTVQPENIANTTENSASSTISELVPLQAESIANKTDNSTSSAAPELVPAEAETEGIANKTENAASSSAPELIPVQAEIIANTTENSASSTTSELIPVQAEITANTTENSASSTTSELIPVQAESVANKTENSTSSAAPELVPAQAETEGIANKTENSASSAIPELVTAQAESIANKTENSTSSAAPELVPAEAETEGIANKTENSASSAAPELLPAQAETEGIANKTENATSSVAPESTTLQAENIANTTEGSASSAVPELVPAQAGNITDNSAPSSAAEVVPVNANSTADEKEIGKSVGLNNTLDLTKEISSAGNDSVSEQPAATTAAAEVPVEDAKLDGKKEPHASNGEAESVAAAAAQAVAELANNGPLQGNNTLVAPLTNLIEDRSNSSSSNDTTIAAHVIDEASHKAVFKDMAEAQSPSKTTQSDPVQGFSIEFTTARTINSSQLFKPEINSERDSDGNIFKSRTPRRSTDDLMALEVRMGHEKIHTNTHSTDPHFASVQVSYPMRV